MKKERLVKIIVRWSLIFLAIVVLIALISFLSGKPLETNFLIFLRDLAFVLLLFLCISIAFVAIGGLIVLFFQIDEATEDWKIRKRATKIIHGFRKWLFAKS